MKHFFTYAVILLFSLHVVMAQNLVVNPGFEKYTNIPCTLSLSATSFDTTTYAWNSPTTSTPDIFTALSAVNCVTHRPHSQALSSFGDQTPHGGNNFAGIYSYFPSGIPDYREYVQGELKYPLVVGDTFIVSMYVSLADKSQFAVNNMGVNFYKTPLIESTINALGVKPLVNFKQVITDTANWVFLSDTIVATAAWQYFVIGNFYTDANTSTVAYDTSFGRSFAYYYLDDVSVTKLGVKNVFPQAKFNTADTVICSGNCIHFNNLSLNATTSQWSFPGGTPSSSTANTPPAVCYLSSGKYNVQLIVSNGALSDTLLMTKYIQVNTLTSVGTITQSRDTICEGSGLTSTLSGNTNYTHLQWQSSANGIHFTDLPGDTTAVYITPPALLQSTYYRLVALGKSCSNDTSNVIKVNIAPQPQANFNYSINGNTVSFNADSSSQNVTLFSWNFGDNSPLSTMRNPTHTYSQPDTFNVCLTVYNGSNCSYTLCKDIDLLTGIDNVSAQTEIMLYPNPAGSNLNLLVNGMEGSCGLKIYNVLGQQVFQQKLNLNPGQTLSIDLNNLTQGTYQLVLQSDKEYLSRKFVHIK